MRESTKTKLYWHEESLVEVIQLHIQPHGQDVTDTLLSGPGAGIAMATTPYRLSWVDRQTDLVATPNTILFYNHGEEFQRRMLDARGSVTYAIGFDDDVIRCALSLWDAGAADRPMPFDVMSAPTDARLMCLLRGLVNHLTTDGGADALLVEQIGLEFLHRSVARAYERRRPRRTGERTSTRHAHQTAVREAVIHLAQSFAQPVSLSDIAAIVHMAPLHFCRIFKRHTGLTIHTFLTQLRLHAALERIVDCVPLDRVATECGFHDAAHLSNTFRTHCGLTPSTARGLQSRPTGNEMRRILQGVLRPNR